jgi:hypothetical protein
LMACYFRVGRSGRMSGMVERAADRAQRLHRVFGDVLPESTTDDWTDPADEAEDRFDHAREQDRWLRDNRPPHYDGSAGGHGDSG